MRLYRPALSLVALCTLISCRSEPARHEEPPETDEVLTGPQRIEWDQPALKGTDVQKYRFVLHIDGKETELADASCGELLQSGSHLCSAELPALSAGRHEMTLVAVHEKAGKRFESRRSLGLAIETR